MAGARQSKASHRREREAREAVTHERITLISAGVLVAVAIIVAIGVVWGLILPPRAHVLTVGEARYSAGDLVPYATLLVAGNAKTTTADPIDAAMTTVKNAETLLQAGIPVVGEPTTDEITAGIKKGIGIPDNATDASYTKFYAAFLKETRIDGARFERLVRSQVVSDRLAKKFVADVPASGPQFHAAGVQSRDQNKIKEFRAAIAGGAPFDATAKSMGLVQANQTSDFGWILPPTQGFLKDTVKLENLKAGEVTEVIERDFQFEVYQMIERDEKRTYTEDQKSTLADQKVQDWIKQQQAEKVKVTEDVSDGERKWITKQIQGNARAIADERKKTQPPPIETVVASATPTAGSTPAASTTPAATASATPSATVTASGAPAGGR